MALDKRIWCPVSLRPRSILLAVLGVFASPAYSAAADNFTILHAFDVFGYDGYQPSGTLTVSGSTLYGTNSFGGTGNSGTVFSIDSSNNAFAVDCQLTYGSSPFGALLPSGPIFYGMTGGRNLGWVYSFNPATHTQTPVYAFKGGSADGANPAGSLIQAGSVLYGVTTNGGAANVGVIFSYDTATNVETVLHAFAGGANDGATPHGSLLRSGNLLYGLTSTGGSDNLGVLFTLDTNGNSFQVLHSFNDHGDGNRPFGSLIQDGPILYGMTNAGGAEGGTGTIFSFDTRTQTETIMHTFTGGANDLLTPYGALLQSGSMLYGIAEQGGERNVGGIFSVDINTGTFSLLHSFNVADGKLPGGDLVLLDNTLYGTTPAGGAHGVGVVFALTLPEPPAGLLLGWSGLLLLRRRPSTV